MKSLASGVNLFVVKKSFKVSLAFFQSCLKMNSKVSMSMGSIPAYFLATWMRSLRMSGEYYLIAFDLILYITDLRSL
jgi:hypothetical protein